jgi:rod shape-determining protein MreD
MRSTLVLAVGLVLLFLQANYFRLIDAINAFTLASGIARALIPTGFSPALALPALLFMGVRDYPLARGAGVACILGYVTDLLGVCPIGLHAFTFVALFLLVRSARLRLTTQTRWMQTVATLILALIKSFVVLLLLAIFGRDTWAARSVYPMMFPHAIATALAGPLVFALLERVQDLTQSRSVSSKGPSKSSTRAAS